MVARKEKSPWKSISEAPRDGTVILGFYDFRKKYGGSNDYGLVRWTDNWSSDGSGVWTDPYCDQEWMEPVYWMPLPEAP